MHGKNLDCFMIEKVEELKNLRQIHAIFMLLREKDKGEKVNRNILFSVIYSLIIYFVFNFPFFFLFLISVSLWRILFCIYIFHIFNFFKIIFFFSLEKNEISFSSFFYMNTENENRRKREEIWDFLDVFFVFSYLNVSSSAPFLQL